MSPKESRDLPLTQLARYQRPAHYLGVYGWRASTSFLAAWLKDKRDLVELSLAVGECLLLRSEEPLVGEATVGLSVGMYTNKSGWVRSRRDY